MKALGRFVHFLLTAVPLYRLRAPAIDAGGDRRRFGGADEPTSRASWVSFEGRKCDRGRARGSSLAGSDDEEIAIRRWRTKPGLVDCRDAEGPRAKAKSRAVLTWRAKWQRSNTVCAGATGGS